MLGSRSRLKRSRIRSRSKKGNERAKKLAALKVDIVRRCGGRCEYPDCRLKTRLDLHHVVKRSQAESALADTPDNLVAICRRHHDMTDLPACSPVVTREGHKYNRQLAVLALGSECFRFIAIVPIFDTDLPQIQFSNYVRPE